MGRAARQICARRPLQTAGAPFVRAFRLPDGCVLGICLNISREVGKMGKNSLHIFYFFCIYLLIPEGGC